jgi:hypothetical protein
MRRALRAGLVLVVVAAVAGLAGCGEREQVVVYKQGKYQGKPDAKPWSNDPSAAVYTPQKWTQGDQMSWENAVKTRNLTQNEYTRAQ